MPAETAMLLVVEGAEPGKRIFLDKAVLLIGRDEEECDLVVAERQVSRHHALISLGDDGYTLKDLGSKNGTFLNGKELEGPHALQDGDEIQIALCVKIVFIGTGATLPLTFDPPKPERALTINEAERSISIKGTRLSPPLSLAQFRLLQLLDDTDGAVCSRDEIVEVVWPGTEGIGVSEQAIDALIRRLRDRLAELDSHNYVVTVRGHGFRMDNPLTV